MNPDNYPKINRLMQNLKTAIQAEKDLEHELSLDRLDSDGSSVSSRSYYGLHISENDNGSELLADLTGLMLTRGLLNYVLSAVKHRRREIENELKDL